ncbi:sugar phosphate isomerase/epimerase [Sphingomonas populi]|uniref:Sugar phosphate isomerase/epimerase n=1 Tax=Sphingomonas populi TaxID=2484750 RepID=A0A4Q6XIY0_9SPHN|nr:TIM barrel protein [Sphingomonas populi]RZF59235.1 sugar phosphate isomerase/epimerase [Sphingomonas populi]
MGNIRWQYAEHWRTTSPNGPINQFASRRAMDTFVKQLAVAGFEGLGMFAWNLMAVSAMFGSLKGYRDFLGERGINQITDIFFAMPQATRGVAPHRPETHDLIVAVLENFARASIGTDAENLVVMPTNAYNNMEPVTDEKIQILADLWNRVGKMAKGYGLKLGCHHEFWGGLRTRDQIDRFYELTDPEYVFLFIDTAQHVIAGVDPVDLYVQYHDRVSGFHFKDTKHVDVVGDYRSHPDAELVASTTPQWFHEMGVPGGLVDFPALMRALEKHQYKGWIGVEHDKVDISGSYPESTALAMWYAKNVLSKIYN